jgi:hypothetical protein
MIKTYLKIKISYAVFFSVIFFVTAAGFHPYYVSVTDIKYKESEKTLQVSCRVFTNDLENALKKIYNKPVDLLHPKDKTVTEKLLAHYILDHLKISINGKVQTLDFIGYEKEEEATWTYFEIKNAEPPKKLNIENSILYDLLPLQINMVHAEVNGTKKSFKVTNPEKEIEFGF